jgi:hypothetical protein
MANEGFDQRILQVQAKKTPAKNRTAFIELKSRARVRAVRLTRAYARAIKPDLSPRLCPGAFASCAHVAC